MSLLRNAATIAGISSFLVVPVDGYAQNGPRNGQNGSDQVKQAQTRSEDPAPVKLTELDIQLTSGLRRYVPTYTALFGSEPGIYVFDTVPFLEVVQLGIARVEETQWTSVIQDGETDRYRCEGTRPPSRATGLPYIVTALVEIDDVTDEVSAIETFVTDPRTILIALSRPILEVLTKDVANVSDDDEVAYILDRCRTIVDSAVAPGPPLDDAERRRLTGRGGLIDLRPGETHISSLFDAPPDTYWLKPSSSSDQPWPYMVARVTREDWTALHYTPGSDDFRCEGATEPQRAGGLPGIVRTRLHYDTGEVPPLDVDVSNHATIVPLLARIFRHLEPAEKAEQVAAFSRAQDYLDECRRLIDLVPATPREP